MRERERRLLPLLGCGLRPPPPASTDADSRVLAIWGRKGGGGEREEESRLRKRGLRCAYIGSLGAEA